MPQIPPSAGIEAYNAQVKKQSSRKRPITTILLAVLCGVLGISTAVMEIYSVWQNIPLAQKSEELRKSIDSYDELCEMHEQLLVEYKELCTDYDTVYDMAEYYEKELLNQQKGIKALQYVAIIDSASVYHRYDCTRMDWTTGWWACMSQDAKMLGYTKCSIAGDNFWQPFTICVNSDIILFWCSL